MYKLLSIFLLIGLLYTYCFAAESNQVVVAQNGSGDYKTITEAIAALPVFNYSRVVIFIKNGVYNEKIRIEQDYITLRGESREKTIVQFSQLREDWNKNPDHIGPAVINIHGDDIVLDNLTIENTQPEIGPHAFAVYGTGTRTIIMNCNVKSKGGDTVSLWNYKDGMYYHANCYFEGAVDFICPRGWCFIKDSHFYEVKKTAALWHAGSYDKSQKLVIKNSFIDGVEGFELARHHYDAQFYFIDCRFSDRLSDKKIYRVTYPNEPERDRAFHWGERYYFYNSADKTNNINWVKDNLNYAKGSPSSKDITAAWTFNNAWDPESTTGAYIVSYTAKDKVLTLEFNEPITVIGKPELMSGSGESFKYLGNENSIVSFACKIDINNDDLRELSLTRGRLISSKASVSERNAVIEIPFVD